MLKKIILVFAINFIIVSCSSEQDDTSSNQETGVIKFYYDKGRYNDVLLEAGTLSGEVRNDPELKFIIAKTYLKIGHYEQALEILESLKGGGYAFDEIDLWIAESLLKQRDVRAAKELLLTEEVQKKFSSQPKLHLLHAQVELAENKIEAAKSYLLKINEDSGEYTQAQILLARIDLVENREAKAVERIEELHAEAKESVDSWLLLANIKFDNQNYVDAENYYLKALALDKSNILTQHSLQIAQSIVRAKTALGNVSTGKDFYQTFLESYPKSSTYYLELAKHAYSNNELQQAEEHLNEILEITPGNPPVVSLLAKVLIKQNKLNDAGIFLQQHIVGDMGNLEWIILKAITDMGLGNHEVVIDSLKKISNQNEQFRFALVPLFAYAHLKNENEENFSNLINRYDVKNPLNLKGIDGIRKTYLEVGKFDEAENFIGQMIHMHPSSNELKVLYLSTMNDIGKGSDLSGKLNQWLSEQPNNTTLKLITISQFLANEDYNSAIKIFKNTDKSELSDKNKILLTNNLKNLVVKSKGSKDQGKVFSILKNWQKALPENAHLELLLADAYIAEKNYKKAIPHYESILNTFPDEYVILNNLAWSYFEVNDTRAVEYAEAAYSLNSQDGATCDTYGWILLNNGEVEKGFQLIEKALEILPEDVDIQAHYESAQRQFQEHLKESS